MSHSVTTSSTDALRQRSLNWLLRNVVLPAGDLAFGQKMMHRLRFLEKAQWWSREQVQAHRDRALASLVQVAYQEVPFYRELMQQAGVSPGDVRTAADLQRLPIITKDMIRPAYPDRTTRDTGQKTYDSCTSGSTGKNFCVKEDAETGGWHRASFMLALEWAGWQMGEPHMQTGMNLSRSMDRRLKDSLLRCHYISAFDLSDASLDRALDTLERHGVQHLWGYPGSLYYLARRALQKGWNQPLRSAVTWGDNLYPQYRQTIEQAFQTRVTDTYGCAEGMQIAAQCGYRDRYLIHSLDVVVELLDDEQRPVPAGQTGNVIVTRLHPGPMPLIRYRIGDVATSMGAELEPRGRGYEMMGAIQGRDTDVIITPSGNRLIVHFFTGILEHFPEIDSFQVVQEEAGAMLVRIVPTSEITPEVRQRIIARLQEKGAADMQIEIEPVAEIPLASTGKRRFVISKLARALKDKQQDTP